MNILDDPEISRRAALAVQYMPIAVRIRFVKALENAKQISDLPPVYQDYLTNGYKTDKVSMPDDDLWDNLEFEWIEE